MANDREKLIELVIEAKKADTEDAPFSEFLADFMIANGVTVQQWIPVTERLPEPYVSVLTLRKKLDGSGWSQKVEHAIPVYGGELAWFMDIHSWKSKVTHWMPLPKMPKEDC